MFLITEDDELGLVSAMMHEAAGGLELPDPAEPALSMLGGKKIKNRRSRPNLLLLSKSGKVLHVQRSVLWLQTRVQLNLTFTSPWLQQRKPSSKRIGGRTWLQLLQTDPTINVVRPSGRKRWESLVGLLPERAEGVDSASFLFSEHLILDCGE